MHQHNPDLIMALAEGQLPGPDASAAEAEIAACAECSEDLAAQRVALDVLGATPSARLSAAERLSLHDTLRRELRLSDAPAPQAARQPQRRRRWSAGWAFGGAAAVLVAVLAVAPTLRLISPGADDAAGDTVAAESSDALTTTTASMLSADDLRVAGDASEQVSEVDGTAESNVPTFSDETTTMAPPASVQDRVAFNTGERPEEALTEFFQSYERSAGDPDIAVELYAKSAGQTTPTPPPPACAPPPGLGIANDATSFMVAVVLIDRVPMPVIGYAAPNTTELVLVVFDPDTCDVMFSLP